MSQIVSRTACFCDQCAHEGQSTVADYLFQPEEVSLQGPLLGDPDYWPNLTPTWRALCEEHYRRLPPDYSLDYVPLSEDPAIF